MMQGVAEFGAVASQDAAAPKEISKWRYLPLALPVAALSFPFAAIAGFEGSKAAKGVFATGTALANVLFEVKPFKDFFSAFGKPTWMTLLKWVQLIPSGVGNLPLLLAAWQGIEACTANPYLRLTLKAFAILGPLAESIFSVMGTAALVDEFWKWVYTASMLTNSKCPEEMYHSWFAGLEEDFERIAPDKYTILEAARASAKVGSYEAAYLLLESNLPYPAGYYRFSLALATFFGTFTAIGFSANGVELIKLALKTWLPEDAHPHLDAAWAEALLWVSNAYPLGFGISFGIEGFRRLFTQILPAIVLGSIQKKIAATTTLAIAVGAVGPGFGVQVASGNNKAKKLGTRILTIAGALSGGATNLAPATNEAGDIVAKALTYCRGACTFGGAAGVGEEKRPLLARSGGSLSSDHDSMDGNLSINSSV